LDANFDVVHNRVGLRIDDQYFVVVGPAVRENKVLVLDHLLGRRLVLPVYPDIDSLGDLELFGIDDRDEVGVQIGHVGLFVAQEVDVAG